MANTASRIYPSGLLSVGGNLDEVTYNATAPAIKNLLRNTEDFTLWSTFNVSATSNVILAPNNFKTADLLTEAANSLTKEVNRGVTGLTIGATYTISVYAKSNGRPNFRIAQSTDTFGSATNATFNLTTGTMVSYSGGYISASIVNIGDGWYRCIASFIPTRASGITSYLTLLDASNQSIYAGNGTSGMYFWGAQLELGSVATEYQGIGTSDGVLVPVPFAKKDNAAGLYTKGSFDEVTYNSSSNTVTNIFSYSEDMNQWAVSNATKVLNTTIAPDGTLTADRFYENGILAEHACAIQDFSDGTFSNKTMTFSVYLKAAGRNIATLSISNYVNADARMNVNLSTGLILSFSNGPLDFINLSGTMTNVGNGWYRCALTCTKLNSNNKAIPNIMTNNGATTYYIGDGTSGLYVWGAQIEFGSTMSEYIPKVAGSIVKRFSNRITANGANYITANYDEVNKPHVVQNLLLNLDPSISPVTANTLYDTVDPTRAFVITNPELCDVSDTKMIKWNRSLSPKNGSGAKWTSSGALAVSNFLYNNHTWEIWFRINDINPISFYQPTQITEGAGVLSVYSGYHGGFMYTTGGIIYEMWDGIATARDPVTWTLNTHFTQGQWHQAVVTRTGNTFAGYINGVAAGNINNSFTYSNVGLGTGNDLYIGKSQNLAPGIGGYVYYTKADFGGMRMYNQALSPAEVLQNFNANRSKFGI